jgi:hypothetical protein
MEPAQPHTGNRNQPHPTTRRTTPTYEHRAAPPSKSAPKKTPPQPTRRCWSGFTHPPPSHTTLTNHQPTPTSPQQVTPMPPAHWLELAIAAAAALTLGALMYWLSR